MLCHFIEFARQRVNWYAWFAGRETGVRQVKYLTGCVKFVGTSLVMELAVARCMYSICFDIFVSLTEGQ